MFTVLQTFNYSLVLPPKDLPFAVNGTSLVTTRPLNFEYRSSWPVVMKSTDSEGLSCIDSFQVSKILPTATKIVDVLQCTCRVSGF